MVEAKLTAIAKGPEAAKAAAFRALVDGAPLADLLKALDVCVGDGIVRNDARIVLWHMAKTRAKALKNEECKELCQKASQKILPKILLFAAEEGQFRRELAMVLDAQGDTFGAIQLLQAITYDGEDPENRIDDLLTLAEFWFDMSDATAAEQCCNRTGHIIHQTTNPEQARRHRMARVRVQDAKRDFLKAAQGYLNLGTEESAEAAQADELLRLALACTILAPAGPRKARLLGILQKDERVKGLASYDVLAKMFHGEIVKQEHVQEFKNSLEAHQNVQGVDGYTVLDKALIEHNIVVIGQLYMNITFKELGNFLGISPAAAEEFVAKMVAEKRIEAVLDQQDELVEFEEESQQLPTYNAQINTACEEVEGLMQDILKAHPQLAKFNTFTF